MNDSLKEETLLLAEYYIQSCLGSESRTIPNLTAATLRRVAGDVERRNRVTFESIQSYMHCPGSSSGIADPCTFLRRVGYQMQQDGNMNWGRLVTLFVFTGVLAKQMSQERGTETSRSLAEALSNYIIQEQGTWLVSNGGWAGFRNFFEAYAEPYDPTVRNAIMAAAGFGLAGLAFLLAVR
ncbi:bcl-2-like protein 10 [Protopterus annectens]|uniref:bcl-2-like protein 10 n=1 Tax=Protopterus annectens TaxID=7888 RepID=UPI001CF9892C|nr:bcl-2-like protein 10 [Protopterus annectens]